MDLAASSLLEAGASATLTARFLGSLASLSKPSAHPIIWAHGLSYADACLCGRQQTLGGGSSERLVWHSPFHSKGTGTWPALPTAPAGLMGTCFRRSRGSFWIVCPAYEGGKGQRLHVDVLAGTGDSSWLAPPLGWIIWKSEQVGEWQQGHGGEKKPPTSSTKRVFVFPMN